MTLVDIAEESTERVGYLKAYSFWHAKIYMFIGFLVCVFDFLIGIKNLSL